jgi:hypothetical protein
LWVGCRGVGADQVSFSETMSCGREKIVGEYPSAPRESGKSSGGGRERRGPIKKATSSPISGHCAEATLALARLVTCLQSGIPQLLLYRLGNTTEKPHPTVRCGLNVSPPSRASPHHPQARPADHTHQHRESHFNYPRTQYHGDLACLREQRLSPSHLLVAQRTACLVRRESLVLPTSGETWPGRPQWMSKTQ